MWKIRMDLIRHYYDDVSHLSRVSFVASILLNDVNSYLWTMLELTFLPPTPTITSVLFACRRSRVPERVWHRPWHGGSSPCESHSAHQSLHRCAGWSHSIDLLRLVVVDVVVVVIRLFHSIVWEPIRKRAHTQLVRKYSATVVSARWATVDWSWHNEGISVRELTNLHLKNQQQQKAETEWMVEHSSRILTNEQKATDTTFHRISLMSGVSSWYRRVLSKRFVLRWLCAENRRPKSKY